MQDYQHGKAWYEVPFRSRAFARGLAWWSFGIAHTRDCGRRTIATWLALLLGHKVNTIEQRLYEWCVDAAQKAGDQRRTIRRLYVDTAPLIYYIEGHTRYVPTLRVIMGQIVPDQIHAITSVLTLTETLMKPLQQQQMALVHQYCCFIKPQR